MSETGLNEQVADAEDECADARAVFYKAVESRERAVKRVNNAFDRLVSVQKRLWELEDKLREENKQ